jgi:Na+/H+-dicarboxylate symporter
MLFHLLSLFLGIIVIAALIGLAIRLNRKQEEDIFRKI